MVSTAALLESIRVELASLTAEDFDSTIPNATGWDRLEQLCERIKRSLDLTIGASLLLEAQERLDGCDLGSPGPIVHTLESMPSYELFLEQSLQRHPTSLSLWMANRILNGPVKDRARWLDLLTQAASHPRATATTKAEALDFLTYQSNNKQ